MKVETTGETLQVSGLKELGENNASIFRQEVLSALKKHQKHIDVDLSEMTFVDSRGLGALLELKQTFDAQAGAIRLCNPTPPVQQILEFTRMNSVFEIVKE
ncbi:MAG: STAS domain-containing protein [Limisphaerales bacterium]